EILRALRHNEATRMRADRMRSVLEVADFVKFAKMRPLPDDNVKSFNSALAFVEDTKPAPEPEASAGDDKNNDQEKDK
ncbi:MAG: cell wall anchor protein, partial [Muribaculaceae bacterium]|nr:cell wall anchor protein [Muribaculaceae bacterium]